MLACHTVQCKDIVLKTKDAMETELQRQSQQHKENVQKLQKQVQMQVRHVGFGYYFQHH